LTVPARTAGTEPLGAGCDRLLLGAGLGFVCELAIAAKGWWCGGREGLLQVGLVVDGAPPDGSSDRTGQRWYCK
jgi:hypothetical protein